MLAWLQLHLTCKCKCADQPDCIDFMKAEQPLLLCCPQINPISLWLVPWMQLISLATRQAYLGESPQPWSLDA